MAWRGIGALLLLAVAGGGAGFGASALADQPPPSSGIPQPLAATGPSYPHDPPIQLFPDPDIPALSPALPSRRARLGTAPFDLSIAVPRGWTRVDLAGNEATWAVATNPLNTYVLRVEIVISQHETIAATKAARIRALDSATQGFELESETDEGFAATYVKDGYRRLTYHRWVTFDDPDPGQGQGTTYAEIATTGRLPDRTGLADLLDRVADGATR